MEQFYKELTKTLSDEVTGRNLKSSEQISDFVERAINEKYRRNSKVDTPRVISDVYRNVTMGITNLPDLPPALQPVNTDTPEIREKIIKVSSKIAKEFCEKGTAFPKIEEIQKRARQELGLTDSENKPIRLGNEIDTVSLSKISTMTMATLSPNITPNFGDEGLKGIYETIKKEVYSE